MTLPQHTGSPHACGRASDRRHRRSTARRPGPFPDEQIALLQIFADQAVIAIENVRLFNETKEALEQQTATSEILRVISGSPTDVQPVFDTIAEAAQKLCRASSANVFTFDGELIHLAAVEDVNRDPQYFEAIHKAFPRTPGPRYGSRSRGPVAKRCHDPGRASGSRIRNRAHDARRRTIEASCPFR